MMDQSIKNARMQEFQKRNKMASIKALAHFIPNRTKYHSQRGKSLDLKSIKEFCSSLTNKGNNLSKSPQRYQILKRGTTNKIATNSNSNQIFTFNPNNYLRRLNNSAIISASSTQFKKQRKRLNEFVSILSKQKKKINSRQIERTTEMIQLEMQRQKYERYFQQMEQEFLKKQYQMVNRQTFYDKVSSYSKDYLKNQQQERQINNESNLSQMIRQTKRNFFQISNIKNKEALRQQQNNKDRLNGSKNQAQEDGRT